MKAPAMLTLCGRVAHVFEAPGGTDKKTGEAYEGGWRVQLLANVPLRNGEAKLDLVTLSTDLPDFFRSAQDELVRVPVGVYALKSGVGFFCLKSQQPERLSDGDPSPL